MGRFIVFNRRRLDVSLLGLFYIALASLAVTCQPVPDKLMGQDAAGTDIKSGPGSTMDSCPQVSARLA